MKFKRGCVISPWHALLFFSSDDAEFIRRFPAEAITHGFSRRRPVRSLQIPPESGIWSHRFHRFTQIFFMDFFVTQISQMTQIFLFFWDFFHRMTRNLFGGFLLRRLLTDFRGGDLFGRYRYPLGVEYVPQISQIFPASISFPSFSFLTSHFSLLVCHFSFYRLSHLSFLICH